MENKKVQSCIDQGIKFLQKKLINGYWSDFKTGLGESDEWVTGYIVNSLYDAKVHDSILYDPINFLMLRMRNQRGWGFNAKVPADHSDYQVQL